MASKIMKAGIALCLAAGLALILNACAQEPFRLHIIANSDSGADQKVKLEVRDAVLGVTAEGIKECKNADEAKEYIKENLGIIIKTANETLAENGFDYKAAATVGNYHFPEKSYRGAEYPEGDYEALRIILGDGKGANWWCVIFPPLCLYGTEDEADAKDTQYTSLFAELWESIFGS